MITWPPKYLDRWIGAALFTVALAALWLSERSVGFVRDESVYFEAGRLYAGWVQLLFRDPLRAFTDAAIVRHFEFNREHPALMKLAFGVSHWIFHDALGLLRSATAYRLPAFAVAAGLAPLLYSFGRRLFGRPAGLFAAAGFFLVPRQFFNSQLACFDVPVAFAWLLVVYVFWRALTEPEGTFFARHGWWLTGLAFGLALATKHNALFLPFVLAPFGLWRAFTASRGEKVARRTLDLLVLLVLGVATLFAVLWIAQTPERFVARLEPLSPATALVAILCAGGGYWLWQLHQLHRPTFRAVAPLAAMAVAGPVIFYLHWPILWHHPVDRTAWYLAFHAKHHHYAWFYLGTLLRNPPFPLEYVLVKTALTVPLSLLFPMVLGAGALLARLVATVARRCEAWGAQPLTFEEALVLANAAASIAVISHPEVPHFGGVKHWFPSMLFLLLIAGACVQRAAAALAAYLPRPVHPAVVPGAVMTLLALPALIGLVRVHPYGTSAYGELAGGVPGAASLGMQRQFWSNNVTGVLPWLNQHAPRGSRVFLHEVTHLAFAEYQRNGLLRPDLVAAWSPQQADFAAYQYHQEFREHEMNIWQAFGTQRPVTGLYLDETPQVIVYRRP